MPYIRTAKVSKKDINILFRKKQIWKRIYSGKLREKVIASDRSSAIPGATSQIVKHSTKNRRHVATTHRIIDRNGKILHWDAKDIRVRGICYYRY